MASVIPYAGNTGAENADSSSVFNGLKAVFVGVYATPTANPLTVITNVRVLGRPDPADRKGGKKEEECDDDRVGQGVVRHKGPSGPCP